MKKRRPSSYAMFMPLVLVVALVALHVASRCRPASSWRSERHQPLVPLALALPSEGSTTADGQAVGTITPEDIALSVRQYAGGALSKGIQIADPVWASLERAEALLVAPLTHRFRKVVVPASTAVQRSLQTVCQAAAIDFVCPSAFVVESEGGYKLLSLPTQASKREFAIFLSGGLVQQARSEELKALLAREIILLNEWKLHVPAAEPWVLLSITQGPPSRARRYWKPRREEKELDLRKFLSSEFVQACRLNQGMRSLAATAVGEGQGQLPCKLAAGVNAITAGFLLRARAPADIADVVVAGSEGGMYGAAVEGAAKAAYWSDRWQVPQLMRLAYLATKLPSWMKKSKKPLKLKEAQSKLRLAYRIGLERLEWLLNFVVKLVGTKNKRKASVFLSSLLERLPKLGGPLHVLCSLGTALRRQAEIRADRLAAELVGSIKPVAAGLTWLFGTAEEKRRVSRGEVEGLIEDAQIQYRPAQRWGVWLGSFVKMSLQPPLRLRLAELADWADSEAGQEVLRRSSVSLSLLHIVQSFFAWLLSLPGRALKRMRS